MAHEFTTHVIDYEEEREKAIKEAEMGAFDSAREYIRGKEFKGFEFKTKVEPFEEGMIQATCKLIFYQKL